MGQKVLPCPVHGSADNLDLVSFPKTVRETAERECQSEHLFRAEDRISKNPSAYSKPIIQEHIRAEEITIDAFWILKGRLIHYVPRLRIRALGGESIQGQTISGGRSRTGPWRFSMKSADWVRGPITVQAFLSANGPVLSEINPVLAGRTFDLAAGGNYPAWIMQMLAGGKSRK